MTPATRRAAETAIARLLISHLGPTNPGVIACYWPHRGEPSVHSVMLRIIDLGGTVVLPAPVRPREPMVFRRWGLESQLTSGPGGIPIPSLGRPLRPDLLIIPVVGFDLRGYRLGYGGGYYDRTLAALSPRPPTIGIGFELSRLKDVRPQAHDVPLDVIVTEAGLNRFKR